MFVKRQQLWVEDSGALASVFQGFPGPPLRLCPYDHGTGPAFFETRLPQSFEQRAIRSPESHKAIRHGRIHTKSSDPSTEQQVNVTMILTDAAWQNPQGFRACLLNPKP